MWVLGAVSCFNLVNLVVESVITVTLAGAIAARQNYTDADIIKFLTNVECVAYTSVAWAFCVCAYVSVENTQVVCVPVLVMLVLLINPVRTVIPKLCRPCLGSASLLYLCAAMVCK